MLQSILNKNQDPRSKLRKSIQSQETITRRRTFLQDITVDTRTCGIVLKIFQVQII